MSGKGSPLIATKLRKLREAVGLSQRELAVKSGLSLSIVCKIEQGQKADPRMSTLQALAAALGVDCNTLIGDARQKAQKKRRGRPR